MLYTVSNTQNSVSSSVLGAISGASATKKGAIPTRYLRRINFDRPQLLAIDEILNAASEMKDSQDPCAQRALFESSSEQDHGSLKFLVEEYISFTCIGVIGV